MSMTREEAIVVLEESKRQNEVMRDNPSTFWASYQMADGVKNSEKRIAALDLAVAALRGPTREMVERMFPGCALCNWGGLDYVGVDGDGIYLSKPPKNEKFRFCPVCGKPLPTLTPPNEWVSVEERLPEVGQEVLVYWRNTSQKAEHFELTHYDGNHWFLLDNTERPWIVVVAWTPLPAPPDRRPPEGEA